MLADCVNDFLFGSKAKLNNKLAKINRFSVKKKPFFLNSQRACKLVIGDNPFLCQDLAKQRSFVMLLSH